MKRPWLNGVYVGAAVLAAGVAVWAVLGAGGLEGFVYGLVHGRVG